MPYQIRNGIVYGSNAVSLTQAQYDALSTAEKNNGTVYYIYDSDAVLDASDVSLGSGTVKDLAGSVATIETSPTKAKHAVGDYIVYNGQLYKVTSAISAGATLTPGTNIIATNVGAELTSLNNNLTQLRSYSSGSMSKATVSYTTVTVGSIHIPVGTWLVLAFSDFAEVGGGVYNFTVGDRTVRNTETNGGGSVNYGVFTGERDVPVSAYATTNNTIRI